MLSVRQYLPEDQDGVWALHTLALEDTGANHPGSWDDDLHDIPGVYLDGSGEFLVGCLDERLVAIGALRRVDQTMGEIKRMRVHPDFQRRGFGQQLLETLEEKARRLGYERLLLDTTDQQKAAQAFYEKNGYAEVQRQVRSFNQLDFMLIYYEKSLA